MEDISIHLITENKKEFLPLLLLGDKQEIQNLATDPHYGPGVRRKDKMYLERKLRADDI